MLQRFLYSILVFQCVCVLVTSTPVKIVTAFTSGFHTERTQSILESLLAYPIKTSTSQENVSLYTFKANTTKKTNGKTEFVTKSDQTEQIQLATIHDSSNQNVEVLPKSDMALIFIDHSDIFNENAVLARLQDCYRSLLSPLNTTSISTSTAAGTPKTTTATSTTTTPSTQNSATTSTTAKSTPTTTTPTTTTPTSTTPTSTASAHTTTSTTTPTHTSTRPPTAPTRNPFIVVFTGPTSAASSVEYLLKEAWLLLDTEGLTHTSGLLTHADNNLFKLFDVQIVITPRTIPFNTLYTSTNTGTNNGVRTATSSGTANNTITTNTTTNTTSKFPNIQNTLKSKNTPNTNTNNTHNTINTQNTMNAQNSISAQLNPAAVLALNKAVHNAATTVSVEKTIEEVLCSVRTAYGSSTSSGGSSSSSSSRGSSSGSSSVNKYTMKNMFRRMTATNTNTNTNTNTASTSIDSEGIEIATTAITVSMEQTLRMSNSTANALSVLHADPHYFASVMAELVDNSTIAMKRYIETHTTNNYIKHTNSKLNTTVINTATSNNTTTPNTTLTTSNTTTPTNTTNTTPTTTTTTPTKYNTVSTANVRWAESELRHRMYARLLPVYKRQISLLKSEVGTQFNNRVAQENLPITIHILDDLKEIQYNILHNFTTRAALLYPHNAPVSLYNFDFEYFELFQIIEEFVLDREHQYRTQGVLNRGTTITFNTGAIGSISSMLNRVGSISNILNSGSISSGSSGNSNSNNIHTIQIPTIPLEISIHTLLSHPLGRDHRQDVLGMRNTDTYYIKSGSAVDTTAVQNTKIKQYIQGKIKQLYNSHIAQTVSGDVYVPKPESAGILRKNSKEKIVWLEKELQSVQSSGVKQRFNLHNIGRTIQLKYQIHRAKKDSEFAREMAMLPLSLKNPDLGGMTPEKHNYPTRPEITMSKKPRWQANFLGAYDLGRSMADQQLAYRYEQGPEKYINWNVDAMPEVKQQLDQAVLDSSAAAEVYAKRPKQFRYRDELYDDYTKHLPRAFGWDTFYHHPAHNYGPEYEVWHPPVVHTHNK